METVASSDAATTDQVSQIGSSDGQKIIVLMGVCGTGKSTLGAALAEALHLPFIDGDDLHPPANVAKMARGESLDDLDRIPWLERVRAAAVARAHDQIGTGQSGVIVACSALKKTYRAVLRGASSEPSHVPTYFVYLKGEREVLKARLAVRQGHFMKADMLQSQLDVLESPEDEPGVVTVLVDLSTEAQVRVVGSVPLPPMDHGGHNGHDMGPMCSMNMLWNAQIIDTCIVFPSWHIRSNAEFVLSFFAIVLISVFYEYLRLFQHNVDARIQGRLNKGKRVASPAPVSGRSSPERSEDAALLSGQRTKYVGRARIPAQYRTLRAVLYGTSVLLGCFLMLVFMTYNAYLIFAVVIGAGIGHYFFSGFVEPDKGLSCH